MAALTDTAGDANGKKGGKKSKGSTTVQGDKEKSDIFKLVSVPNLRFCRLSSCNQSCCNLSSQRQCQASTSAGGWSITVPLDSGKSSEQARYSLEGPRQSYCLWKVPKTTQMLLMAFKACPLSRPQSKH